MPSPAAPSPDRLLAHVPVTPPGRGVGGRLGGRRERTISDLRGDALEKRVELSAGSPGAQRPCSPDHARPRPSRPPRWCRLRGLRFAVGAAEAAGVVSWAFRVGRDACRRGVTGSRRLVGAQTARGEPQKMLLRVLREAEPWAAGGRGRRGFVLCEPCDVTLPGSQGARRSARVRTGPGLWDASRGRQRSPRS